MKKLKLNKDAGKLTPIDEYMLDPAEKYVIDIEEEMEFQMETMMSFQIMGTPPALKNYHAWLFENGFDTEVPNPTNEVVAILLAILIFIFSSPTRAIKANALIMGCEFKDVVTAEFEKSNDINPNSWGDKYIADSELEDKLTGTAHSTWYVYRILFINIPQWACNV